MPNPDKASDEDGKTVEGHDPGEPLPPRQLTPEEQMDLYEQDLKENDWGHQPC